MTVASIRAQFGLLPAGDPYGDPTKAASPSYSQGGIYSVVSIRNSPSSIFKTGLAAIGAVITNQIFLISMPYVLQKRYVPNAAGDHGPCTSAGPLANVSFGGGPQGAPFQSIANLSAAIPVPLLGSILNTLGAFFSNPCRAPVAQLNATMCQISATLTNLLAFLDQAVGLGRATPAQAAQLWDQYVAPLAQAFATASADQCQGTFIPYFAAAVQATGDFSKNIFWPDIYPKTIVVNPGSPTISTATPAPANQFAATPASAPAAVVPSITQPPNSLPGSPTLGAPIVRGVLSGPVNYGTSAKNAPSFQVAGTPPAQPLPQGISTSFISSLAVPALVIAGLIAAAIFL